ncbi:MAG: hypothetical protein JSV18_06300 [Candidatus Bathyarchaeota archaeon]|nr:MAG: hypothetical protein JSV18_06300 [Candidatus Bathyarchaeota archaeon]
MSRKLSAVVSAAITFVIFALLPSYVPSLIPPQYSEMIAQTGIDLAGFTNQISMIGVIIATLTLVKGFVPPSSPIYILASIGSSGVTLAFTIITLSLGNLEELGNLGLTTLTLDVEGGVNTAVIDMRFFFQLTALTVVLSIIHSILEFSDARKESRVREVPRIDQG